MSESGYDGSVEAKWAICSSADAEQDNADGAFDL